MFSIELSNASGYLGNTEIQVSIINDDVQPGVIGGGGGGGGGGSGGGAAANAAAWNTDAAERRESCGSTSGRLLTGCVREAALRRH